MKNTNREEGLIGRKGDLLDSLGRNMYPIIRMTMAEHRKALMPILERGIREGGRYIQEFASRRKTTLPDGTTIETFVNPYGLCPTLSSIVKAPGITKKYEFPPFIIERGCAMYIGGVIRIYLSTDDMVYFDGEGDEWSWGTVEQAQGVFRAQQGILCDSGFAVPKWTDNTRKVDEETNSYTPTITRLPGLAPGNVTRTLQSWINDQDRQAIYYTGLMRLAVQCCGINYDIKKWRPDSFPAWDARYYGLIRQKDTTEGVETLRYWLVYAGPAGVYAAVLRYHETVYCLIDGLYGDLWDQDQAINAEGSVMVTLRMPPEDDDDYFAVQLMDSGAMDTAFGSEYSPIQHGWHFSPQKWGTASETQTACITLLAHTINSGGYLQETRRATISFSFDGLIISHSPSWASPGQTSLYYKANVFLQLPTGSFQNVSFTSRANPQGGDIYGVYDPDGPNWIPYNYTFYSGSYPGQSARGGIGACGGGGASSATTRSINGDTYRSGFGTASETNITFSSSSITRDYHSISTTGTNTITGWLKSYGGVEPQDGYGNSYVIDPITLASKQCSEAHYLDSDYDYDMADAGISIATANGIYAQSSPTFASGLGTWALAFLWMLDPTVYVILGQLYKRLDGDWTQSESDFGPLATSCSWGGEAGGGAASFAWGVLASAPSNGAQGTFVEYDADPPELPINHKTIATSTNLSNLIPYDRQVTIYYDNDPITDQIVKLYSAGESINLDKAIHNLYDDTVVVWRPFGFDAVDGSVIPGPDAVVSYTGEIIYKPYAGAEYISNAGYDETAVQDSVRVRHLL